LHTIACFHSIITCLNKVETSINLLCKILNDHNNICSSFHPPKCQAIAIKTKQRKKIRWLYVFRKNLILSPTLHIFKFGSKSLYFVVFRFFWFIFPGFSIIMWVSNVNGQNKYIFRQTIINNFNYASKLKLFYALSKKPYNHVKSFFKIKKMWCESACKLFMYNLIKSISKFNLILIEKFKTIVKFLWQLHWRIQQVGISENAC
jgi:hypothetical protein